MLRWKRCAASASCTSTVKRSRPTSSTTAGTRSMSTGATRSSSRYMSLRRSSNASASAAPDRCPARDSITRRHDADTGSSSSSMAEAGDPRPSPSADPSCCGGVAGAPA